MAHAVASANELPPGAVPWTTAPRYMAHLMQLEDITVATPLHRARGLRLPAAGPAKDQRYRSHPRPPPTTNCWSLAGDPRATPAGSLSGTAPLTRHAENTPYGKAGRTTTGPPLCHAAQQAPFESGSALSRSNGRRSHLQITVPRCPTPRRSRVQPQRGGRSRDRRSRPRPEPPSSRARTRSSGACGTPSSAAAQHTSLTQIQQPLLQPAEQGPKVGDTAPGLPHTPPADAPRATRGAARAEARATPSDRGHLLQRHQVPRVLPVHQQVDPVVRHPGRRSVVPGELVATHNDRGLLQSTLRPAVLAKPLRHERLELLGARQPGR